MKKSKKTIIYMLIALVVAVSAVFVDFGSCYAQSYSEDVPDADWFYYQFQQNDSSKASVLDKVSFDVSKVDELEMPDYSSTDNYKYHENIDFGQICGSNIVFRSQIASDSEIVFVLYKSGIVNDSSGFSLNEGCSVFSKSTLNIYRTRYIFSNDGNKLESTYFTEYSSSSNSDKKDGLYFLGVSDAIFPDNFFQIFVRTHKMKVFFSVADAKNYLNTGDTSGLAWQGSESKQTYDSELLLNDFDVQFHDSNKFEECYLDVRYTIPDALKSVGSFQIDMEEKFDWCGHFSGSVSDWQESHTGTNYIDVLNHADGFRIYLKDIEAIDNFVDQYDGFFNATHKRQVLGSFTGLNIPFGDYLLGNVKVSCLDIKFHLVANKKYGHYVDYNLNLLTGIGVKNSYVPDNDGNYTSNNDSKVNGHYYTDVGTDAAGNTTYNYYYYYSDGSKEKVSSEDAANNTITNTVQEGAIKIDNSPTFTNNNNITIEGDTISNSASSYADSKSDATTNKSFIDKFLGFFEIIENNSFLGVFGKIFGWLPTGISSLITTALGIIVGIRVFKAFH